MWSFFIVIVLFFGLEFDFLFVSKNFNGFFFVKFDVFVWDGVFMFYEWRILFIVILGNFNFWIWLFIFILCDFLVFVKCVEGELFRLILCGVFVVFFVVGFFDFSVFWFVIVFFVLEVDFLVIFFCDVLSEIGFVWFLWCLLLWICSWVWFIIKGNG